MRTSFAVALLFTTAQAVRQIAEVPVQFVPEDLLVTDMQNSRLISSISPEQRELAMEILKSFNEYWNRNGVMDNFDI